jgi:hypothetical protein
MRRQLAVLLVSLLLFPQVIAGQGVRTLVVPGARVRVTHPAEGTRVGTALAITDDLLFVRWRNGSDTVGVPLAEVTQLDVGDGKHKYRALKYAGIGLVGGAGLGAMVGAASYDDSDSFFGQGAYAAGGAFVLGSLGGIIGLVSGVLRSEPWQEVPLDRSRVGIVVPPGGHGTRLGFALAF